MTKKEQVGRLYIEHAEIIFPNFSGREGKYNPEGQRNFNVLLDLDQGEELSNQGWNVKYLKPRDEGDSPRPYLPVAVGFSGKGPGPEVVIINSTGRSNLTEDLVSILDWAEFENIDLVINPYFWEVQGKSGIKAYLKQGFFTLVENPIEAKYLDVPDSGKNTLIAEEVDESPF